MATTKEQAADFIERLTKLDRGDMAALRRMVIRPVAAYPVIYRAMPKGVAPWAEQYYLLVAKLFGRYPKHQPDAGNLGHSWQVLGNEDAPARRFERILSSDADHIEPHLLRAMQQLARAGAAVDYVQLLTDVMAWRFGDVQRHWARSYYAPEDNSTEKEDTPDE